MKVPLVSNAFIWVCLLSFSTPGKGAKSGRNSPRVLQPYEEYIVGDESATGLFVKIGDQNPHYSQEKMDYINKAACFQLEEAVVKELIGALSPLKMEIQNIQDQVSQSQYITKKITKVFTCMTDGPMVFLYLQRLYRFKKDVRKIGYYTHSIAVRETKVQDSSETTASGCCGPKPVKVLEVIERSYREFADINKVIKTNKQAIIRHIEEKDMEKYWSR